jgi:hypothetical protein
LASDVNFKAHLGRQTEQSTSVSKINHPVMAATREKSFSKLKIINAYLRTNMDQDMLRVFACLFFDKEAAFSIIDSYLVAEFAAWKSRRFRFNVGSTMLTGEL